MTIKELKEMPVGSKAANFVLTVKTAKKSWLIPYTEANRTKDHWMHQVVLTDDTGDMLADVNIVKNIRLQRTEKIKCIVCEIRSNYTNQGDKLLYVDQFERPGQTADEYDDTQDEWEAFRDKTVRSKIKCLMTVARIDTDLKVPGS